MDDLREQLESFKLPIGLILVGLVLITGGLIFTPKKTPEFPKESIVDSVKIIKADISGAIENPGVYELEEGSRVEDLIKKAGGFTKQVNDEYVSKNINLAQKVADSSKFYIPKAGEVITSANSFVLGQSVAGAQAQVININTASQKDLESLPGIGPVTAVNIIQQRPFYDINELLNKKIVTKSTFEKIKANIVTN